MSSIPPTCFANPPEKGEDQEGHLERVSQLRQPSWGSSGAPPLQRSMGRACISLRMVRRPYSFSGTDQLREHRGEEDEVLRVAWGGDTVPELSL